MDPNPRNGKRVSAVHHFDVLPGTHSRLASMKTMPFWQPLPAGQVNAISGPNTSQGNEVVKRIEIPERLAVMMAMTFKERKEFQIGTYGFHDLMDDLPLFKEKIIASFEPNEEEVDCPYGCPRMKVERMRYHLEGLHIPGRPKSCNLCPKKYTGYQALLDHVEGFHCDWTFTCKVCEKEVSRKDMINHFRFRCMGIWPPLPKRTEWSITADGYFTLF
ncbi:hypothetical protein BDN72DRAFT_178196 [Pluteus cervinus]|uniref:Uncharacterized protein n=1 Tax=Pluteus cervinus TaxID=181527 RepID=A0ACD3AK00_9AGAR|nr:hypothetical protein BDN72DRAFT_178196 [Pluteus cervinus]